MTLTCHFDWEACSQSNAWLRPEERQTANQLSEPQMSPPLRLMSSQSVRTWTQVSSKEANNPSHYHQSSCPYAHIYFLLSFSVLYSKKNNEYHLNLEFPSLCVQWCKFFHFSKEDETIFRHIGEMCYCLNMGIMEHFSSQSLLEDIYSVTLCFSTKNWQK